jgi:hypothetical protein
MPFAVEQATGVPHYHPHSPKLEAEETIVLVAKPMLPANMSTGHPVSFTRKSQQAHAQTSMFTLQENTEALLLLGTCVGKRVYKQPTAYH